MALEAMRKQQAAFAIHAGLGDVSDDSEGNEGGGGGDGDGAAAAGGGSATAATAVSLSTSFLFVLFCTRTCIPLETAPFVVSHENKAVMSS